MKWFAVLLLSLQLHGQETAMLLEGTIGTHPVVMNLSMDDNQCGAVYFYKSSLHDIKLNGDVVNGSLHLYCTSYNPKIKRNDTSETFVLKAGAGIATGTWTSNDGRTLDVSLYKADITKVTNPFGYLDYVAQQKAEDAYNYLRIASIKLINDTAVKWGKFTIQKVHVVHSEVVFPRIISGGSPTVLKRINDIIDDALIESACMFFSCSSYSFDLRHVFVTSQVISINAFTDYYCGGAHPDYGNEPININAKTGNMLALEDVLYLSKDKVPAAENEEWLTYRSDVFAPRLIALLTKLHPVEMKRATLGQECDYSQKEAWSFPKWYFTDQGLYLSPDIPHVEGPCRDPEWSVIPFATLNKYSNPKVGVITQ